MIRNPLERRFSVEGEAWFIDDVFLMAAELSAVERVERQGPTQLHITPADGVAIETIARIIQEEIDKRYGQTE